MGIKLWIVQWLKISKFSKIYCPHKVAYIYNFLLIYACLISVDMWEQK